MPQVMNDDVLIVIFKNDAVPNEIKTRQEGRLICDDREVCEVRAPGSRNVSVFPANAMSHWETDRFTGGQRQVTYAERFASQYNQFRLHQQQTRSGTPLEYAPFLTEARRAELRSLNIYTLEALSHVDGQELKNLGQGGRDLKNQATDFIMNAKAGAGVMQLQAQLTALEARNLALEEDINTFKSGRGSLVLRKDQFEKMSSEQLRAYIVSHTGHLPQGDLPLATLKRMALEAHSPAPAEAVEA